MIKIKVSINISFKLASIYIKNEIKTLWFFVVTVGKKKQRKGNTVAVNLVPLSEVC